MPYNDVTKLLLMFWILFFLEGNDFNTHGRILSRRTHTHSHTHAPRLLPPHASHLLSFSPPAAAAAPPHKPDTAPPNALDAHAAPPSLSSGGGDTGEVGGFLLLLDL